MKKQIVIAALALAVMNTVAANAQSQVMNAKKTTATPAAGSVMARKNVSKLRNAAQEQSTAMRAQPEVVNKETKKAPIKQVKKSK